MRVREFPVLTDDDRALVDRLAAGLGDDPARVLAYLLRRAQRPEFADDPASSLAVQVGTELNRSTVRAALDRLVERDLVAETTIRDDTRGRPPKAWRPRRGVDETVARAYDRHAAALVAEASEFTDDRSDLADDQNDLADDRHGHTADQHDPSAGEVDPSADDADASLSVALNWRPNGLHAPLFLADANGSYDDRGLSVELRPGDGSRAALDSVVAGDADVGIAGAATLVRARAAGDPVVPVASLYQHATATIYALEGTFDGAFERAAQLRGRRVGTPIDSEIGLLGRLFLSQAGVLDDVDVVDLGGEERDALVSGAVDAVTGSFADPRRLSTAGTPVESLAVADRFPIPGPAIVVRESALSDRRGALIAFLAAATAGWAAAERDPGTAATVVAERSDRSATEERRTVEEAVEEFGSSETVRKRGWGWRRADAWRRLETALERVGLLDGDPA